jgi:hypothetical protein
MSLDDLLPFQDSFGAPLHGDDRAGYGTSEPLYEPYEWRMPLMRTPPPDRPPFEPPEPRPVSLPTYSDGLMTEELFWFLMQRERFDPLAADDQPM